MKRDLVPEALLEEIRNTDNLTLQTGKDESGVSYLSHIFKIHFKLFGETCSGCPGKILGYINKIKNYNPMSQVEKKSTEFRLQSGVIIPVKGTSEAYSQHNMTDEIAIELLAVNPNRKSLFATLPADVDQRIDDYKKQLLEPIEDADLVIIGNAKLSVAEAISLLEKLNVNSKATTVSGVEKKIKELKKGDSEEFVKLAEGFAANKLTVTYHLPEPKTIDELQFELDKAQQDFDDATEADKDAAKQKLEAAMLAISEAKK